MSIDIKLLSNELYTLDNAHIIDGLSETSYMGRIVISGGRIQEVGQLVRSQGQVFDLRGKSVTPGFIDAHFHAYAADLNNEPIESSPLSYLAVHAIRRLSDALRRGFTTVRDVAGGDAGLDRAIAEKHFQTPEYYFTGSALSQTGGHGDSRLPTEGDFIAQGKMLQVVDGVENLRTAVRERFRQGAHAIKVMTSGGVVSQGDAITDVQYSAEELRVITDEAARQGSYVTAHAYTASAIVHSLNNGVLCIEHGNLLDAETADLMREYGAGLVPTLIAYDAMDRRGDAIGLSKVSREKNKIVLEKGMEALKIAYDAGVTIGFGSDLMGSLADEQSAGIRLQCEVLGPDATIRSLTSGNAKIMNHTDLGVLKERAKANLVVWSRNPLSQPDVMWTPGGIKHVILGGDFIEYTH